MRDSGAIGAGYEDDLKSGQYKPKGGLNITEGGSFKIYTRASFALAFERVCTMWR